MGQPGSGVIGGKHSEAEAKYSSSSLERCPAADRNDGTEKDPDRQFGEHIPQIGGIKIRKNRMMTPTASPAPSMTAALTMPLIRQAGFSVLSVPIPVPSFLDKTPGSRIRYSFPKYFYQAQPERS